MDYSTNTILAETLEPKKLMTISLHLDLLSQTFKAVCSAIYEAPLL